MHAAHHDYDLDKTINDIQSKNHFHPKHSARIALRSITDYAHHVAGQTKSVAAFYDELQRTALILTQADLRHSIIANALRYVVSQKIKNCHTPAEGAALVKQRQKEVLEHFRQTHDVIVELGENKIKHDSTILLYGFSEEIIDLLTHAHHSGNKFKVLVADARPSDTGQKAAQLLGRAGVDVHFVLDSHLRFCVKQADLAFIAMDSIDAQGKVHAVMGSEMVTELCWLHKVPVYVCGDSWQYDPLKQETQQAFVEDEDVWQKPPIGVNLIGYAYEKINPDYIQAILCDFGILSFKEFLSTARENLASLF